MLNFKATLLLLSLLCSHNIFAIDDPKIHTIELLTKQLNAQKGNVVYVDFWASWCIPCRKSFPWMNELQKKYQSQGLKIISINLDHNKTLAIQFLDQNPANFPIIYDSKGLIAKKYKIRGMPSSLIIDRHGRFINMHTGFNKEKSLVYEQELINLLTVTPDH